MQRFFDINLFFFGNKLLRHLKSIYKLFMTIILVGYMGSGKSTIGQKLSKVLKFDYIDLDAYIQNQEDKSIPELFKTQGEIYFRKIESRYLQVVLTAEHSVISLGGGTPCYGNNMNVIKESTSVKSIYLKASIPSLVERLFGERAGRPLISHLENKSELTEFIGKHLFERSFYYNQADVTITTDGKSIDETIANIVMELY